MSLVDTTTHPYKTLSGFQSLGDIGSLGIRIEIAGSCISDAILKDDDLQALAYKAQEDLKYEVMAAVFARDPRKKEEAALQKARLLGCFEGTPIFVEPIPNGYCPRGCCRHLPWWIVTTSVGRIKIGWRKRVINIDWSETAAGYADDLFPDESVTKGDHYIHAWSYEDAQRYVTKIVESAKENRLKPDLK